MADIEKVIKCLELCRKLTGSCKGCPYENVPPGENCMLTMHDDALELLKEQEAVEPIRKKLKFSETCECGNCHEELFEGEVIRDNYCPNCGRAVKWE